MHSRVSVFLAVVLGTALLAGTAFGQFRSTINGTVLDPNGAAVPNAELQVTHTETGAVYKATAGGDGNYTFPNLVTGVYDIKATAAGFKPFVQRGITLTLNQIVRVDVKLELGTLAETVEVVANASPLNFENSTKQEGVDPQTINDLPLIVSGAPRTSAQYAVLMPGVTTGNGANAYDARINGGITSGDEAVMDGVSMQQGTMSQSGMISMWDFRMTPDMISEFKVLTANYEPQYGSTTSANIMVTTKSGTNSFHGGLYEYLRNTALNARQFGADVRSKDIEHDAGGYIGGPVKAPGLWSSKFKTYFYFNFEAFRITGGVNRPTISIPSMKERNGDFSDWVDSETGQMIPVYDPATTWKDSSGTIHRQQFMGCDGKSPNVICPDRFANSLANQWFKYLPEPNRPGPIDNYLVPQPVPDTILAQTNYYLVKIDEYFGDKDHFAGTIWRQTAPPKFACTLPLQLCNENYSDPQNSWVNRLNWDHTFSPTVLNHFAAGYLNRNEGYGTVSAKYVNDLPQISGVANNKNYPPRIDIYDWSSFGTADGLNTGNVTTRPAYVANDLVTWVKGKHTWKFGGEYRNIGQNFHTNGNESGTFGFGSGPTGLLGEKSGNSIASFLLEQVDYGSSDFRTVSANFARADAWIAHAGDTYRATSKLSINYGIRYDLFRPTVEKYDRLSFFDPNMPNPAAGGRLGALAFAGSKWGSASFGDRHPEQTWHKGFSPRLGIAYAPNDRTVVRTGYGIFYNQAFYPGWGGGMALDGFNTTASFGSTDAGLTPAFILSQGLPQTFARPPFIDPGAQNGRGVMYRPKDANRLSYSQQWNLTIERQIGKDMMASIAYVGNKGTRLPSRIEPLNALNPSLLSMGEQLYDEFEPGQEMLDGVAAPYAGWAEQLLNAGCSPSVAQALLPYPQYCDSLRGLNENIGYSTYHSFQAKAEKRFSNGTYLLASYTFGKLITTTNQVNASQGQNAFTDINPYQRQRNKTLAIDDVPQTLSVSAVYALPFGKNKRFLNSAGTVVDKIIGGWTVANIFRVSSPTPLQFGSGYCNVPGEFRGGCIPGVLPGANVWAQDKGSFDPNKPLFDRAAFEPESAFNYYLGSGAPVSNIRAFGYHNWDMALYKDTKLGEHVKFQLRGEFFNIANMHTFTNHFHTDISSTNFGMWDGGVSDPRNIQLGARLEF